MHVPIEGQAVVDLLEAMDGDPDGSPATENPANNKDDDNGDPN